MREEPATRRRFLEVCGAATAAGALGMSCAAKSSSPAAFGDVSAGNLGTLPVGTLQRVASNPVFIGRDAGGLYSVTITCTHEGCDLEAQTTNPVQLTCPCHGSRFDANGAVLHGPASSPLAHFAVEISMTGEVTIHGGTQVEPTVRVAAG